MSTPCEQTQILISCTETAANALQIALQQPGARGAQACGTFMQSFLPADVAASNSLFERLDPVYLGELFKNGNCIEIECLDKANNGTPRGGKKARALDDLWGYHCNS